MKIEARKLSKIYGDVENRVIALDRANLEIDANDFISPDTLSVIEQNEMVQAVAAIQFSLYDMGENTKPIGIDIDFALQKGETFQVAGLNSAYLDAAFGGTLSDGDMERLKAGTGCIVRNPLPLRFNGTEIPRTEIKEGETITVAGVQIPVLTTLDGYDSYISIGSNGFTNGVQVNCI